MKLTAEQIAEINLKIDLLALLDSYNIEYQKENKYRYSLHCPFHDGDREASLKLYTHEQPHTWHCFGCKKGTDAIEFLRLLSKKSFHEIIAQFSENKKLSLEDKIKGILESGKRHALKDKIPRLLAHYNLSVSIKSRSLFHRFPEKFTEIQSILREVDLFIDGSHDEIEIRRFFRLIEGKLKRCST